ncbi:YeiH family protein [Acetobacter sp.]|uniref:YeiH family protein n=1 Tax=Acetobacter sp. TaxID=440 RepID=UPI0025C35C65|nr:putative sulfate exporter family transporter [Acetobacter sp.]MCH4091036.1 putative sulfate exporter family transporter [Acetobacter sp.]MCI1300219.1 putative sulfate exporter family transporter [Acetobacter sp.]MCI1316113.1 putative sulfate exporter family transporter [Acetobacter sp.]
MKQTPRLFRTIPGLLLSMAVAGCAILLEQTERFLTGSAWIESLVLAILAGAVLRTLWKPSTVFESGIHVSAHTLLETAVALMGAAISVEMVLKAGPALILGIVGTVGIAIGTGVLLGRAFGLPPRMALLIACGNAICGNSAIAAVAPAIDADSDEAAIAVAFTAVLGIVVVMCLPVVAHALHLTQTAGGVMAGLTVYAVPQVLAAAGPMGATAVQIGTLVKLVRVLMLGPVVAVSSLVYTRRLPLCDAKPRSCLSRFLPPFILIFMGLMTARSLDLVPHVLLAPLHMMSGMLTLVAMAALGLGVDLRNVLAAGPRVMAVVTLSLGVLGGVALLVARLCCQL